jgi:hypothetical protein
LFQRASEKNLKNKIEFKAVLINPVHQLDNPVVDPLAQLPDNFQVASCEWVIGI